MKRFSKIMLALALTGLLTAPALGAVTQLKTTGSTPILHWQGLSTDTKPTTGGYGSTFFVTDTGVNYIYTNAGWKSFATSNVAVLSIAAGTNNIGDVDIASIAAGDNNIGNVDIASEIPAGTKTIGKVDVNAGVNSIGTVGIDAGVNSVGTVGLDAGETHVGEVGGNSVSVSVTPTITAGAYSADDNVGGKLTISSATRVATGKCVISNLTVVDKGQQNANLFIYVFDTDPSNGTYTDNGALSIHNSDAPNCVGVIKVFASDYASDGNNVSVAMPSFQPFAVQAASGTSLYALISCPGTPTYTSTSDLVLRFGILRD